VSEIPIFSSHWWPCRYCASPNPTPLREQRYDLPNDNARLGFKNVSWLWTMRGRGKIQREAIRIKSPRVAVVKGDCHA